MTHIYWLEQSAGDVPAADDWLGAEEAVCLAGLRFPKRRAEWRLGRWTGKQAVAALLGLGPPRESLAEIQIRAAASGAPEVFLAGRAAEISISLSHRAGRGLAAVTDTGAAPGCDLEVIEPRSAAFVEDYFTSEEQDLVRRAPAAEHDRLVALVWSAKESVLKALRTGLRASTRSVSVHPRGSLTAGGWQAFRAHAAGTVFEGWGAECRTLVRTLAVAPGCPRAHSLTTID